MPRDEASRSRLEVTGESVRGSKPGRAAEAVVAEAPSRLLLVFVRFPFEQI